MNEGRDTSKWLKWLILSGLVIALDQATKAVLASAFRLGESLTLTPFFDLVFVFNRGAAFNFLSDAAGWQRWFFIGLALIISAWIIAMLKRHAAEKLFSAAMSLILGGAMGNVVDRVNHGAVVDFLSFHVAGYYWPAFNVADSAITVGVALMLWEQLTSGKTR
ncbi:MAG: signal peptidase II [Proteobacteria bacterium]|nr:signal peptidase II [Pseudomonadota bacterium]